MIESSGTRDRMGPERAIECSGIRTSQLDPIFGIRREILGRVIPLGEKHLRWLVTEYVEYYNTERPHQGVGNRVISSRNAANDAPKTKVVCEQRARGTLVSWARKAA